VPIYINKAHKFFREFPFLPFREQFQGHLHTFISKENKRMKIYQVSFYRICPGCTTTEDDVLTAFVEAKSFDEAEKKVEQRYKQEFERAKVFAIAIPENMEIII